MGIVHRAHDPVMDRDVAIKTILLPHGLTAERREEFQARFLREAQAAGSLSHPGIVTVYDFNPSPDSEPPYIAMEFVDGRTLHDLVCENGALNPDWALFMAETLADALALAHSAGIIHRDLKPANILVRGADGLPKITDFGVARVQRSDAASGGATYGSPSYTAPECIQGRPADERSDLFSLAVILYEALSGERPFGGDSFTAICNAIVHEPLLSLRGRAPDLAPAFERFFERALAKDPAARFQDGRSFVEALHALRAEQVLFKTGAATVMLPSPGMPLQVARPERLAPVKARSREAIVRRWTLIGLAALVLALFGFAAGWGLRGTRPADARQPGGDVAPPGGSSVSSGPDSHLKPAVPPASAAPSVAAPATPAVAPQERRPSPSRLDAEVETSSSTRSPPAAATRPVADASAAPASSPRTGLVPPRAETPDPAESVTLADAGRPPEERRGAGPVVPAPVVGVAYLDLVVKSSIKAGSLVVLVDGEEVYSTELLADSGKLSLAFKKAVGKSDQDLAARIEVAPGPHTIEAQVFSAAKSKDYADTLAVDLEAGETQSLRIVAGRSLGRRLTIKPD